jgi:ATP-dependent RNA helicase RhlE
METTPRSFGELGLSPDILEQIARAGFEHPTPIQEMSIPIALRGSDLIGCAQTGTGKTLAFCLPLLEKLKGHKEGRALILCPTREIAMQTSEVLRQFGGPFHMHHATLIGGRRMGGQIQELRKHPHFIVATPGRLMDHWERRNISLKHIGHVVLDEADHMLDLGFLPAVQKILSGLPEKRQTLMFSATFPYEIERLAKQFLHNPERVDVAPPGTAAAGIEHHLYLVDPHDKRQAVLTLLEGANESTLIFTRTKLDAEWLYRLLSAQGHNVHTLHSDRSQGERIETLAKFKKGEILILVATDLLARGIDVSGIAHVVNFDIPQNPEDYIHRVGRTARGKATGHASTLATPLEKHFLEAVEKQLGAPIPRRSLPGITEYKEMAVSLRGRGRKGKRVRLR